MRHLCKTAIAKWYFIAASEKLIFRVSETLSSNHLLNNIEQTQFRAGATASMPDINHAMGS